MRVGGRRKNLTHADRGGGHKNLTFADGGGGGGVQNGRKNADVINERPLRNTLAITNPIWIKFSGVLIFFRDKIFV